MKVKFLKDITVDVMDPSSGETDTFDRLMRRNTLIECDEVTPISSGFSNVYLNDGTVLIDLRNDCFQKMI